MTLKFDPNQSFQIDAVQAAVDAFAGQPRAAGANEVRFDAAPGELFTEHGVGNRLLLSDEALLANVQAVQARYNAALKDQGYPDAHRIEPVTALQGRNFSVEMETGTGKTYVYLRTLFELHRVYGWKKFVLVVPSVAIREGALQSLRLLSEHFATLYDRTPLDVTVFSGATANRLRAFASANTPHLLVLNIDAFNKKDVNIIYQQRDLTGPYAPIEYLQASNPVVILDEPQNMESANAQEALAKLNPLCTLRYSATHRNPYNLLYRLNPVQAYDLRLVKRIEVDSVVAEDDQNQAYVGVDKVSATKTKVTARITIDIQERGGVVRKTFTVSTNGTDLFDLSGGRALYRGFVVDSIHTADGVTFSNGVTVPIGQAHGGRSTDLFRVQIRQTIRSHFDRELAISRRPPDLRLKVLSLFFIDRVANYVPDDAKLRVAFVEAYDEVRALPKYAGLTLPDAADAHAGYFASDRAGAKDTNGGTKADDEAYELIMRDKERLLSFETPLRFIFSHSALREGWDNPNVFTICTLNETKSETRKRQEIGRGLRLPVQANGERCLDEHVNLLTVVANESYHSFAAALQSEIESETGISFAGRIKNKRDRTDRTLKKGWRANADFIALWDRIKHRTRYRVHFETEDLVREAARAIAEAPHVAPPSFRITQTELETSEEGLTGRLKGVRVETIASAPHAVPDLLAYLQRETELTRPTLAAILRRSGRLGDVAVNPQAFLDLAAAEIKSTLATAMVDGIKYEKLAGPDGEYAMYGFENAELSSYTDRVVDVENSLYDRLEVDSEVERRFAEALDSRNDVRFFLKLPFWFKVDTPIGTYNPDWAVVLEGDRTVYLVAETKGTTDLSKLRSGEADKIHCGDQHFAALRESGHDVDYQVVTDATEIHA